MKFQDSTAKDAPMDKSGTVLSAVGTLLAPADTHGTLNTEDVTLRPFNAHKVPNGMEPCAFVLQATTWLVKFVSNVHPTLLGMEKPAMLKFLLTNAVEIKSSSIVNACVKMVSTTLMDTVYNAQLEQHGTVTTVTAPQPATGVWVSQTLKQSMEVVHAMLDTLNSTVVASPCELISSNYSFIILNILYVLFFSLSIY